MDWQKLSGKDEITVFDFLTRTVEETERFMMAEHQAYILQPQSLSNPAVTQLHAVQAVSRYSGVTWWPETVQNALQKYGSPSAIREACTRVQIIQ